MNYQIIMLANIIPHVVLLWSLQEGTPLPGPRRVEVLKIHHHNSVASARGVREPSTSPGVERSVFEINLALGCGLRRCTRRRSSRNMPQVRRCCLRRVSYQEQYPMRLVECGV